MVASTGACDVGTARPTSAVCASDMRVGLASPAGASERGTTPATVGCSGPSLDPGLAGWLAGGLRSRSRPPGPQKLHCTRGGTAVTAGTRAGARASENRQDHVHARGERGEQAEPVLRTTGRHGPPPGGHGPPACCVPSDPAAFPPWVRWTRCSPALLPLKAVPTRCLQTGHRSPGAGRTGRDPPS